MKAIECDQMRMPKPKLSPRTFDAVRQALLVAVDEGEWDVVKGLADVLAMLTAAVSDHSAGL
jgi:hypothetical protein